MKRILLLSGYDAKSHRHWRKMLTKHFTQFNWTVLALADRHFSWRMGGNALTFAAQHEHSLKQSYDLILATSMTDLCGLFGLFPHLGQIPSILYFHENQFAYPANKAQPDVIHYQLTGIKSAMAAKQLIFNSTYNQSTFITGVSNMEQAVPDGFPTKLASQLKLKSQVLAVPLSNDCFASTKPKPRHKKITITWNHRWEHDKAPETLLKLLACCEKENPAFTFNVIGQQFRQTPSVFKQLLANHKHQIKHFGYIEKRQDYLNVLKQSDVVLSTALHEFQGLAVMEAVACGCVPLLPDRLAYQDFFSSQYRYNSTPKSPDAEAQAINQKLEKWAKKWPSTPDIRPYSWSQLENQYQNLLMNN